MRPIISEPDDRAVILISATLILHPSVNNAADCLVDVVWTHVLEIPDYFQTSRLADTQANSRTDTHRQHFSGHFSREPSLANYSLDGPCGLLVKRPHKISNSVVKLPRIALRLYFTSEFPLQVQGPWFTFFQCEPFSPLCLNSYQCGTGLMATLVRQAVSASSA